jgi:hypothetical protein
LYEFIRLCEGQDLSVLTGDFKVVPAAGSYDKVIAAALTITLLLIPAKQLALRPDPPC